MNLVKAKFIKNGQPFGRAYTYRTNLTLVPGDIVEVGNVKGQSTKGIVIDEPVDEEWVKTYGAENLKEIKMKITEGN